MQVITVTQCVPEMSEHEANTVAVILASKAMSHVEGGWPKDIDYSEVWPVSYNFESFGSLKESHRAIRQ